MITFAGIDHLALTVTDLDVSERFYTEVLDFMVMLDIGYGRICMHPPTGFSLALLKHDGAAGGSFTELTTGLDHLGMRAGSREELVEWEQRFDEAGVRYTPIRDMEFGYHLNFRDPDNIALELSAPNEMMTGILEALASGNLTQEQVYEQVAQLVGPEYVPKH